MRYLETLPSDLVSIIISSLASARNSSRAKSIFCQQKKQIVIAVHYNDLQGHGLTRPDGKYIIEQMFGLPSGKLFTTELRCDILVV